MQLTRQCSIGSHRSEAKQLGVRTVIYIIMSSSFHSIPSFWKKTNFACGIYGVVVRVPLCLVQKRVGDGQLRLEGIHLTLAPLKTPIAGSSDSAVPTLTPHDVSRTCSFILDQGFSVIRDTDCVCSHGHSCCEGFTNTLMSAGVSEHSRTTRKACEAHRVLCWSAVGLPKRILTLLTTSLVYR